MPLMNGLQALQQIRTAAPDTKVIMLTVSDRSDDLVSAIENGAYGYLLKSLDSQSFIASMRGSKGGESSHFRRNDKPIAGAYRTASKEFEFCSMKPDPFYRSVKLR